MKKFLKQVVCIAVIAAMGISFGACGKGSSGSSSSVSGGNSADVDNIAVESATMLRQLLTVQEVDANSVDAQEATEAAEENSDHVLATGSASDSNSSSSGSSSTNETVIETEYVNVTDSNGENVTNAAGETETEIATVIKAAETSANSGSTTVETNAAGETVQATDAADSGSSQTIATANTKTYQAYWLDMSQKQDVVFDGQWIVIQFKVKEDAADGNYPVSIAKADLANWDAQTLTPSLLNGNVTVGDATPSTQPALNDGNFTIYGDYVTAKKGDTIEVAFNMSDNPGFVGFIFQFSFDGNALEYTGLSVGKEAEEFIELEN